MEGSIQKFGFINGVDNVNWPPYRDSKTDVSSVSPSSERIQIWREACLAKLLLKFAILQFKVALRFAILYILYLNIKKR